MSGCRWQVWATLTVLALLWTCGGPVLSVAQYLSHTPKIVSSSSVVYAALGFLWIGLPVTGVCAFFGYRNSHFRRKQRQYKEVQDARESEAEVQTWLEIGRTRQAEQRATASSITPSSTQHAKLETAQMLIQEKNYDAARAALKTVGHPEAEERLDQIDMLSP